MDRSYYSDKDYNLWWLILQMRRFTYRVREKELFGYGTTPEEVGLLFVVNALGHKATPAEISRWLMRQPQSTSGLLTRMERKGLVRRVKDLGRKDLVRIAITTKGEQLHRLASKRESIHRIMTALSENERRQLESCLVKLRDKALKELEITQVPPFPTSR